MNNQKGVGIVETLVAVAILGTCVTAFVISLSAGSLTVREQNIEMTAQNLAQTQMEYTKNAAFVTGAITYPVLAPPATYSVTVRVTVVPGGDNNIQKVTVSVYKGSDMVVTISDYKVKR